MTARFVVGDTREVTASLADGSVDLILTSPPFLALRSYLPADHPDKGKEIGSEANPAAFIDVLLQLTAEWRRILAPHGSICIELGDTYSGSGGAGGDYNADGLRDGHPTFDGSGRRVRQTRRESFVLNGVTPNTNIRKGDEWPLAKSLALVPELYRVALAYGLNPLTGAPSPAGRWRVRNVVRWVRPNPPVGALGDKFRPATSDLVIACTAGDRFFDLDAVRVPYDGREPPERKQNIALSKSPTKGNTWDGEKMMQSNPAGAPPLDWWQIATQPDLEIGELECMTPNTTPTTPPSSAATSKCMTPGGSDQDRQSEPPLSGPSNYSNRNTDPGTPNDWWQIVPGGYSGSHFAVWPKALCERPIEAMCPRRVCRECGKPSRRITGSAAMMDSQPALAVHIREHRRALGFTARQVNEWFPGSRSNWIGHWEDTTSQPLLPTPEQWEVLRDRLGLDAHFDDVIKPRSTVEYVANGNVVAANEKRNDYGRGGKAETPGQTKAARQVTDNWSSCGCPGTDGLSLDGYHTGSGWRPGLVYDPFGGSATTAVVAHGHSRNCLVVDIDERNAALAQERLGMFLEVSRHGDGTPLPDWLDASPQTPGGVRANG